MGFDKSVVIIRPQTYFFMPKERLATPTPSPQELRAKPGDSPRLKAGKPRSYYPDSIKVAFEEYVAWADNHPINIKKISAGQILDLPTERPLTITDFCLFAGISRECFYNYGRQPEYSDIVARIREYIESDQLRGAMIGMYESTIVSRVLRLADRQDITTNGKEIQSAGPAIYITIDEAAASIIQSIGKQNHTESGNE